MRQVLILGAMSPIGCRLAETLCERGPTVVALVDRWVQAPRLARLPVRMIEGHVADREALGRAMEGCDVAFHCAEYDRPPEGTLARGCRGALQSTWRRLARRVDSAFALPRRNLECANAVLSAASQNGIRRVICLNAAAVPSASEEAALRYHRELGLSVTVLRPATLYGPFCSWTADAIRALRNGRKPRGGPAPCLYVDHLVEAMLLAAGTDAGAGDVFPLHDQEPASCEELLEAHVRAFTANWEPASATRACQEREADPDIQRARHVLGYNPSSGFAQNMECTAAWIRWSRL
jgi:nucleoside-diphosphate-sugar epimerase